MEASGEQLISNYGRAFRNLQLGDALRLPCDRLSVKNLLIHVDLLPFLQFYATGCAVARLRKPKNRKLIIYNSYLQK
jgi:hypothetical protein